MTATLTIDASGQIDLPEPLRRIFGVMPGVRVRAEVTPDRIEIVKDIPVVSETMLSPSGRLVLAPMGVQVDAASAVREEREALANRALRK
jgi:bifunctional DNA-binding transcriptional regulator/antitoxin component of YhaV-PrlF toxin-antitoxin module